MKVVEYTDFRLREATHRSTYRISMHLGGSSYCISAHIRDADCLLFLGNTLFFDYRVMGEYGSKPFLLEYRS